LANQTCASLNRCRDPAADGLIEKESPRGLPFCVSDNLSFVNLLYLIRHGQAGTREAYDRLSSLGQAQARALGVWLAREGVQFDATVVGELLRQQETAAFVLGAMEDAGSPQPLPQLDPRWNEFDLDAVYAAVAPRMAAEDPVFHGYFQALRKAIAAGDAEVHRKWTSSDNAVVQAWIEERYSCQCESWADFIPRVRTAARESIEHVRAGRRIAVFTSATPVAIAMGLALPLTAGDIMHLAGAALNSNVTILSVNEDQPHLFAFNWSAHLENPELRTFR
jgi:broad specificity phosphatase PhoE